LDKKRITENTEKPKEHRGRRKGTQGWNWRKKAYPRG
jgi:hypothetical protein